MSEEPQRARAKCKKQDKQMRRNFMRLTFGALLFALSFSAHAQQQANKLPRLGYLTNDSPSTDLPRRAAFRQGLRDLGYIEGQNIAVEYRVGDGQIEKLSEMMDELLRLKVDVIFVFTTSAVQVAKKATKEIPIVMGASGDPVALGFVDSIARPGGNITGLSTTTGPEIFGKQLELLKESVPKVNRVAALSNPVNVANVLQLKETKTAAQALGLTLLTFEVKSTTDIANAFAAMKKERAGALTVLSDPMLISQRIQIAELAVKNRLPAIYGVPEHAEAGGLLVYAASRLIIFRRATTYVDKILKGAKPADLPIEQPIKFDFIINLKAAKQIGLTIPPDMLARADRVIK
jgi:putative ABC transport system substrate-binding protein